MGWINTQTCNKELNKKAHAANEDHRKRYADTNHQNCLWQEEVIYCAVQKDRDRGTCSETIGTSHIKQIEESDSIHKGKHRKANNNNGNNSGELFRKDSNKKGGSSGKVGCTERQHGGKTEQGYHAGGTNRSSKS